LNQHPLHIKYSSYRLAVLTFFFLLAALQSPAQRHGKRPARHTAGKHYTEQTAGMPDSVSTTDEELHSFATDTVVSSEEPEAPPVTEKSAEPDSEEKEPPLVLRSVPDSVIAHRKKERAFAYANDPSWWQDDTVQRRNDPSPSFYKLFDSKGFRYFIYIFLGSVLLYALYKIIAENNLRFFYRTPSKVSADPAGEAELPEEDLDQLLQKALNEKAHRPAVRYLYLKTLHMLEARQLIKRHIQTTDEEYARQLDQLPQGESFRWLMRAYERVWYGKFPLNDQQFDRLLQYFQDFHTSIDQTRRA